MSVQSILLLIGGTHAPVRDSVSTNLIQKISDGDIYSIILLVIAGSLIGAFTSNLIRVLKNRDVLSYTVAIVGLPESGKTTLIVSLFQEIFSQRLKGINATLKGDATIERLNEQIERKESGLPVGPTNDQTMFAYRTNIVAKRKAFFTRLLFKTEYRVEFGDYPGEYSEEFSDSHYFNHLKKTDFFKWCIEANAYIFIIDVAKYALEEDKKKYVAVISKTIRESWQHFIDKDYGNVNKTRTKPVLLIFNKMDVCDLIYSKDYSSMNYEDKRSLLKNSAFSTIVTPDVLPINTINYSKLIEELDNSFFELIQYLRAECKQFNVLHTSSFGKISEQYPDVQKILHLTLPKDVLF